MVFGWSLFGLLSTPGVDEIYFDWSSYLSFTESKAAAFELFTKTVSTQG